MAFKEIAVDSIVPKQTGGRMALGSKFRYVTAYALIDFDSDDDVPNLRAVRALLGAYGAGVPVPFSSVSTFTINWQTDIPPGETDTYANIFGNMYPKPYVYDNTDKMLNFGLTANRATPGDITTNLTTVVFDFGIVQTGTIQF